MAGYVLALDQGTTSSRAIIYDDRARSIQISQKPTVLTTPKAGFVEQDAMQIWHTQISCAHDAMNQAGLLATDISSLAITNQRESIVVWDKKTGKPLAPAIIWQDRRTDDWCQNLSKHQVKGSDVSMDQHVQSITGLRIDPYFSASKIVWLLNNHPNLKDRAQRGEVAVGTIDSWLMFKLTGGEHVIDITNASRTLLYDINKLDWSDDLINRFDINKQMLPKVLASDGDFGKTKKGLFAKQIPIQAVLGDQQAALFGQGCVDTGMAKNTYGTGCFMLMNIGDEVQLSQHHLLTTVGWQRRVNNLQLPTANEHPSLSKLVKSGQRMLSPTKREVTYALEGSVFMAGAIVQWLRDNMGLFNRSQDIESLAKEVDSSEQVVLVPAFTGLGAPYWRSDITASLAGMTRGSTKAHIARAALESIAFQTYDVLTAMQKDSPSPLTELRVDGGAANNDLLMQFQADMLGVPVLRPKDTEITAKGVALLAGITAGLYDESTIDDSWYLDQCFEPSMAADERGHHLDKWHQAIGKTLQ
ncbi:glycerol kinase GlpK [Psychrobacter sp.]|uniref:glycerol kinase GlpK n=1 Tax=Psychrobacter sp. TaxID=56811 RepID=UPI0025D32F57|nr:glycerol kinase GlpK [Psychrobacter sp.]